MRSKDFFEFWYQHNILEEGDWSVGELEIKVRLEVEFDGDEPYDWVIEGLWFQANRYNKKTLKFDTKMIPIEKTHTLYADIAAGVYEVALDKINDAIQDGEIGLGYHRAVVKENRYDRLHEER